MKINKIRTIALEEHFAIADFMKGPGKKDGNMVQAATDTHIQPNLIDKLCDLSNLRISDMDTAGVDIQVLSLNSPGTEQLGPDEAITLSRKANDYLAAAIQKHPKRFLGLATLPTSAPDAAVDELERMVLKHGFKGAVINGHVGGRYLDDEFFWPILECAEKLRVPIYLHPTPPPQSVIDTYYTGNFSSQVTNALSSFAWGWHIETAVNALRLILSGALDRYPKLQIVIGHMGETLPFMISRLDLSLPKEMTKLNRSLSSYLRENFYYTFSGFNYAQTFLDLLLQVGVDRIMFSADYPYGSMDAARTFLDQLPISPADKERIAHGNAEHLLRL